MTRAAHSLAFSFVLWCCCLAALVLSTQTITCSPIVQPTEVLTIDNTTTLIYNTNVSTPTIPSYVFSQYSTNDTEWRNQTMDEANNSTSTQPNEGHTMSTFSSTICACSYCSCNGNTCPLGVYYFTQLIGRNCPSNTVASIGNLAIQSTDSDDGFKYYITDESNKNLALARKAFAYLISTKSMPGSSVICAYDDSQKMRIQMNSVYVVAESTNMIFNTYLRYSIDIDCVVPPYSSVSTQFSHSGQRVYEDTIVQLVVKFISPYGQVDTWQKGDVTGSHVSTGRVQYVYISNGEGLTTFYPPSIGPLIYQLNYYPNNVYGASNQYIGQFIPFTVYKIATKAKLYPKQSTIQITSQQMIPYTIQIDYEILDNDGSITPDVPSWRFRVFTPNLFEENFSCGPVSNGYGIGTVYCKLKVSLAFNINVLVQYQGTTIGNTWLTILPSCYGKSGYDKSVCSGNGNCIELDTCFCRQPYGGNECEIIKCAGILATDPQVCSAHGSCSVNGTCICTDDSKWGGQNCQIPKCNGTISTDNSNVCSGRGLCVDADQCVCPDSWTGKWCEIPKCGGLNADDSHVCSGRGRCVGVNSCTCDPSYAGEFCEIPLCNGTLSTDLDNVCHGHGNCTNAEHCDCSDYYGGLYCETIKCGGVLATDSNVCTGRGECKEFNTCQCNAGFIGSFCEKLECTFGESHDGLSINIPTPTITSTLTTSNAISFEVSFAYDQTVPYKHLMFIGSPKFSLANCTVYGDYQLALYGKSNKLKCWRDYATTHELKLSDVLNHPLVTKQPMVGGDLQDDLFKVTMPLTLQYFDATGESNDAGLCRSFEFKTTQTIYLKSTCLIEGSFVEYSPLAPYSAQLYSSESTTIDGVLNIVLVMITTNATLESFTFYNTSSIEYSMQVTDMYLWFKSGQKNYYIIEANSGMKNSDFRATIFFKSLLKRKEVLDIVEAYFPVTIEFEIVQPPSNQNFTLQADMILASDSTNWTPKSTFIGNDRVFVKVSSKSFELLETNHLSVKDAYLCCFKEFVASLPENGCLNYNPNTMDVWKQIIASTSNTNAELSTTIHPFSNTNYAYGFSFSISSSLFPEKLSTTPSACFVQSRVGTKSISKRGQTEENSTLRESLFLVDLSQKRTVSNLANSLSFGFLFLLFNWTLLLVFSFQ